MPDEAKTDLEHLLSPEQVARVCGLSRRAVYRAISRGELRAARLCNRLRVAPAEVERWVEDHAVSVESPIVVRSLGSSKVPPARGSLRALLVSAESD
jgi:excisionase family DNA binding protein